MALVAKPAAFTAATLTPAALNTLMDTIFDEFGTLTNGQGNITNENVAVAAALARTKIADTGVVCGNTVGIGTQTITRPTIITTMGVPSTTTTGVPVVVLHSNTTAVGNLAASGPDDLMSYTLPASVLVTTNRGLYIRAWGITANNANAKAVRFVFGSQTLLTSPALFTSHLGRWDFECIVLRTGASTQDIYIVFNHRGSNPVVIGGVSGVTANTTTGGFISSAETVAGTQTETGTIVIKAQSTASTADNDVVQEGMLVLAI